MGHPDFDGSDAADGDGRPGIECGEVEHGRGMQQAVLSDISWTLAIFLGIAVIVNMLVGANF